jgi:hypothetical protein
MLEEGFESSVFKAHTVINSNYVAFNPANKLLVIEHKVVDEKYSSDHLPVWVILKVNKYFYKVF